MYVTKLGLRSFSKTAIGVSVVLLSFVLSAPIVGACGGNPRPLSTTYGGRGFGVGIETLLGNQYFADTGSLPSDGGALFADFTDVGTDVANGLVWLSYTRGFNGVGVTEPMASDLTLLPGNPLEVGASFAYARSSADCGGVSGWSEIADLTVGGVHYDVTGEANQVIYSIPGVFTLVANEQIDSSSWPTNALTVNALDLWTPDVSVIVSSAYSSVTCSGGLGIGGLSAGSGGTRGGNAGTLSSAGGILPSPLHVPPHDFMTGGGWFSPPNSNRPGRVNFGFNAGPRPGNPTDVKGHVNVIDHDSGDHIQGTDVTDYFQCANDPGCNDPQDDCRIFAGPATFNGAAGYNFRAIACDYGEPGRADRFSIEVRAGGTTVGSPVYFADNYRPAPPS